MDRIKVELLNNPDLNLVVTGARTCWQSFDKSSHESDEALLKRLWALGHHTPFENLVFTFRVSGVSRLCLIEITRHRISTYNVQCISGDSMIITTAGLKPIKTLYESFQNRQNLPKVRVFDIENQIFTYADIAEVFYTGEKDVYKVTTKKGKSLIATSDHRFLTPEGWKILGELKEGDEIYINGQELYKNKGLNSIDDPYLAQKYARGFISARREKILEKFGNKCIKCGATDNLEIDHIKPIKTHPELACDINNLQVLCRKCHREKSNKEIIFKAPRKPFTAKLDTIESITYAGKEQTYDIEVDNINQNYIANGIVVHNSTRFTLKKALKKYEEMESQGLDYVDIVKEFFVMPEFKFTGELMDYIISLKKCLNILYNVAQYHNFNNDTLKYLLPESWRTEFIWTINFRSLANFIKLRYSNKAHFEIRHVAKLILDILKKDFPLCYELLMGDKDE